MRCKTIALDRTTSLTETHSPLNARKVEDAVNKALEAIEAEGNRIVSANILGSKLGPGEVTTIENAMLMVLFEPIPFVPPSRESTLHPAPDGPAPGRPVITCGSGSND